MLRRKQEEDLASVGICEQSSCCNRHQSMSEVVWEGGLASPLTLARAGHPGFGA